MADWRRDVGWLSRPCRTHRLGLSAAKCGGCCGCGGGWSARSPGRLPAGSRRIRVQPARYLKTSPPPRSRWRRRPKTLGESPALFWVGGRERVVVSPSHPRALALPVSHRDPPPWPCPPRVHSRQRSPRSEQRSYPLHL